MKPAIAYILKGFPRVSETFIANEVRLLSRYGVDLGLFSIKQGDELAQRADLPVATYAPATTSLSGSHLIVWLLTNGAPFLRAQWFLISRVPGAYFRTAWFAARSAFQYRHWSRSTLKKTFIKEFLFATFFAHGILLAGRYSHLHAHFCHDATTVAWITSMLTGLPFSFTAHAKDIYQKRQNPDDLLARKIKASEFVVTCTRVNADTLRGYADHPSKIHAIYHGLDTRLFRPGSGSVTARPRFLAVGRHVAKKGFDYLLKACANLRDRGVDFELCLIGESGDQTVELQALMEQLHLHDRVYLEPPMRHEELAGQYRDAAAFVLPCVVMEDGDRDGIPNVMAEAMASGVPVVVTGVSGIPELVSNGVNGIIVPSRNSQALADAMSTLLDDANLRVSLGGRSQATHRARI